MQRNIELKAWDFINHKIIYFNNFSEIPSDWRSTMIMLQSTGFRDKYGNKLYHKDRVSLATINTKPFQTEIETHATVEWDDSDGGWYYMTDTDRIPYLKPYLAKNIILLGSTFEIEYNRQLKNK